MFNNWTQDLPMWLAGCVLAFLGGRLLYRTLFRDRSGGRPLCQKCWYDLTGVQSERCPECGRTITQDARTFRRPKRKRRALAGLTILIAGAAITLTPKVRKDGIDSITPTSLLILFSPTDDKGDINLELHRRIGKARDNGDEALWEWQWALLRRQVVKSFDPNLGQFNSFRAFDRLVQWQRIGGDVTIRVGLLELIDASRSPAIREEALHRMDWFGLLQNEDADRIAGWLAEPDQRMQRRAIDALRGRGMTDAVNADACVDALFDVAGAENWFTHGVAVHALAKAHRHFERVIPMLNDELMNKAGFVRANACVALAEVGAHDLIDTDRLVSCLDDVSGDVRACAVRAVSRCTSPDAALEHLVRMLHDSDDDVRRVVFDELATRGPSAKDAASAIARVLLDNPVPRARGRAARTLDAIAAEPAVAIPALVQALGDPNSSVRAGAAWVLGQYGKAATDALPALESATADDEERVRDAVIEAISLIRNAAQVSE